MRWLPCTLALLLIAGTQPALAETYRWTDPKSGQTIVSDTPPSGQIRQFRTAGDAGGDEKPLPEAVRKAAENFPVTLYTSADCGQPCADARQLLAKRGIPFTEKALKESADFAALKSLIGEAFVPTLQVGKQTLKGFQPDGYHDRLDWAGYPGSRR